MPLSATLDYTIGGRSPLLITVDHVYNVRRLLEGRYARAVVALQMEREKDAQLGIELIGGRSLAELGECISKIPGGSLSPIQPVGVKALIFELRRILRGDPRSGETGSLLPPHRLIETVRGVGYVLQCDVLVRMPEPQGSAR